MKHILNIKLNIIFLILINLIACNKDLEKKSNTISDISKDSYVTINQNEIIKRQLVYVPVYSEIHHFNEKATVLLTANLSIHNIDLKNTLFLEKIDYYNTQGKLVKKHLPQAIMLRPLETKNIVVDFLDKSGGVGANFLVTWSSKEKVKQPIIEAIMVSTAHNTGISFMTQGRIVEEEDFITQSDSLKR